MSSHCSNYPSCNCPTECGIMCGLNPSTVEKVSLAVIELQKALPWCSREELIFACLKPLKEWGKQFNEENEREFKEVAQRFLMNKLLEKAPGPKKTPLYTREQFTFGKRPGSNTTPSKKKRKKK